MKADDSNMVARWRVKCNKCKHRFLTRMIWPPCKCGNKTQFIWLGAVNERAGRAVRADGADGTHSTQWYSQYSP